MILIDVPKNPRTSQRIELDDDGIEYTIKTDWSSKYQRFYMSLYDSEGEAIIEGLKLVAGTLINVGARANNGPAGVFLILGSGGIKRDSFETGAYKLYYMERENLILFPLNTDYVLSTDFQDFIEAVAEANSQFLFKLIGFTTTTTDELVSLNITSTEASIPWNWGDGTVENVAPGIITHTYSLAGSFVAGTFLKESSDPTLITEISSNITGQIDNFFLNDDQLSSVILPDQNLDLTSFPVPSKIANQLTNLDLGNNSLSALWNIGPEVYVLENLLIENNSLTSVPVNSTNFPVLKELELSDNALTTSTTVDFPLMETLKIDGNNITELDIVTPLMKTLECFDCVLSVSSQSAILQGLVDDGILNGTLLMAGTNDTLISLDDLTNIGTLVSRGWTVEVNTAANTWFDFYGSLPTDLPWPWLDNGAATIEQSTDTVSAPYTTRFSEAEAGVGTKSTAIDGGSGNLLMNSELSGLGAPWIESIYNLTFDETTSVSHYSEIKINTEDVEATYVLQTLVHILINGDQYYLVITRSNDEPVPPASSGTNGAWRILSNFRTGSVNDWVDEGPYTFNTFMNLEMRWDAETTTVSAHVDGLEVRSEVISPGTIIDGIYIEHSGAGVNSNHQAEVRNRKIMVKDKDGVFTDYYSPNLDRWSETPSSGGYQLTDSNQLQQIVLGSGSITSENLMPDLAVTSSSTYKFETIYPDLGLVSGAISGIQRILRKLTYLSGDFYDYGFENDNGTDAFFVDKNGSNELTELGATPASSTVTVERDDFTFSDFDGGPQASPDSSAPEDDGVFTAKWNYVEAGAGTVSSSVSSGKLVTSVDDADASPSDVLMTIKSGSFLTSEKVVMEVTANVLQVDPSPGGSHTQIASLLYFVGGVAASLELVVSNVGSAPPGGDNTGGSTILKVISNIGGSYADEGVKSFNTQYDLKIQYDPADTGSEIRLFVDDIEVRSSSNTGAITFSNTIIADARGTSQPSVIEWNDFKLFVDDVEYTEKRGLIYKDSVLKYAIDDADSDVTGFEPITSNTDAAEDVYSITDSDNIEKDGLPYST